LLRLSLASSNPTSNTRTRGRTRKEWEMEGGGEGQDTHEFGGRLRLSACRVLLKKNYGKAGINSLLSLASGIILDLEKTYMCKLTY